MTTDTPTQPYSPLSDEEIAVFRSNFDALPFDNDARFVTTRTVIFRLLATIDNERHERRKAEEDMREAVFVTVAMIDALNDPDPARALPTINTLYPRWKRIEELCAALNTEETK